jgi:plastocyanin
VPLLVVAVPAVAGPVTYGPDLPRATADRIDDVVGPQVHLMYVLPSDGTDRALDTDGTIAGSVSSFQTWLAARTGDRALRFDTYGGSLDITFFRLARTDATIESFDAFVRDEIEDETTAAGFDAPGKIYAVYYDGMSNWSCGGGAWPPTLVGNVAALYLNGLYDSEVPCRDNPFAGPGDPPAYAEFAMLHEIMHTLGFVATCAPNHTRSGHTSDNANDLMWAGDGYWAPGGWGAMVLDDGHDDYYGHRNGSCRDFDDSAYLGVNPTCPTSVPVAVDATSFTPATVKVGQGGCVAWTFQGPGSHSATESGLIGPGTTPFFDSKSRGPGWVFSSRFAGAGRFAYRSKVSGDPTTMTGAVDVPVRVSATIGTVSTAINVRWMSATMRGYRSDVQLRFMPPLGTYGPWTDWRVNQIGASAKFSASGASGPGVYQFRARLENAGSGRSSGWSRPVTISIAP